MDLSLTEQQQQLKASAREFMAREASRSALLELERAGAGLEPGAWQAAAEIGFLGMLVPEDHGGSGSSLTDCAVVFEEFGRGPLPGPFFSSAVLGSLVVGECASEDQKAELLPSIARGEEIVVLALTEPDYGWEPESIMARCRRSGEGYVLDGTKLFVHDGLAATKLLCVARADTSSDEPVVVVVNANSPGVSRRALPGFFRNVTEVRFESVRLPVSAVLAGPNPAWTGLQRAIQKAIPVLCSYKAGGCRAVFEMSAEYSRTRIAFGVPIGRFQRVQDHIIEVVNRMDAIRWTANEALWKMDTGREATASVHLAKAVASEGYYHACNFAHEAHGGIGTSAEYGLNLHTSMSRSLYHYLGDPAYHRRRMIRAVIEQPDHSMAG